MRRVGVLLSGLVVNAVMVGACTSSTTPTPVAPVAPIPDPPRITCPASQTAQSLDGNATAVAFPAPTVTNGQAPMTNACAPASGSPFSVGQRTVTCTAVDALQRADSCQFLVTVLAPRKLAATAFLAFGDSITWGEDGQNAITVSGGSVMLSRFHPAVRVPDAQRYPTVLVQSLSARYKTQSITMDNQGNPGEAAGDQTASLTALARFMGLTSSGAYTVALIMEGSNDIYYADPGAEPPAVDALQSMVRNAKGRSIRPYIATIPPMNPTTCVPICRGNGFALVSGFNDKIRSMAATEGVTVVDVERAFNGDLSLIGPDGLHPNPTGYAKIASTFFTAITQTLESSSSALSVLTLRRPTIAAR